MLKADELNYLANAFQLSALHDVKPLVSGDVNTAYRVANHSGDYVVKRINKQGYMNDYAVTLEKLIQSITFSEHIAKQLSESGHVMSALPSKQGYLAETEEDLYLLYPYLDAIPLENEAISINQIKQIAAFLRQLHQTRFTFDSHFAQEKFTTYKQMGEKIVTLSLWETIVRFTHKNYFFPKLNALSHYVVTHRQDLLNSISTLQGDVICHNDLKPKNVLWQKEHFWVVDWETAGLFNKKADYVESLLAWCTVYDKRGISLESNKLMAFMAVYPPQELEDWTESLNIVLIKWYFWLAFCLSKLIKNPKKFKSNRWHIRYSIHFILFLINGQIISQIKKTEQGRTANTS